MSFKPDYGLRLLRDGKADVNLCFLSAKLHSLTVLGPGHYSTMVEVPYGGTMHALSLDFNQEQLERILSKASTQVADFIHEQLKLGGTSPRTIDFEGDVDFGVRARLGQPQQGQYEIFIPLIAQEIFS